MRAQREVDCSAYERATTVELMQNAMSLSLHMSPPPPFVELQIADAVAKGELMLTRNEACTTFAHAAH